MGAGPELAALQAALERDPLSNFSPLGTLAQREPLAARLESSDPLQAVLVFGPPQPGAPYLVWLWGREPEACGRLLSALPKGSTCWVTTPDRQAAEAAKGRAGRCGYEAAYVRYSARPEAFRPSPAAGFSVRQLGPADAPALAGPRPGVSQALARGLREPNRIFGVVEDGAWRGDVFCFPAHGSVWVIGSLYVAEDYRQQGIGKALVTACTEYVFSHRGRPAYDAHEDNAPSRRTVETLGYEAVGEYRDLELTMP